MNEYELIDVWNENEHWFEKIDDFMNENSKKINQIECESLRWKIDIIMNENSVIEKEHEDLKNKF